MKLKNILLAGMAAVALSSCNDYLDVDAPSAYTEEFVFEQKTEVSRALNGVYAQALVSNLYGNAYQSTFIYNSDVDLKAYSGDQHAHNAYARFDCDEEGGEINSWWTASYNLIEYANRFISSLEKSELWKTGDAELKQYMGEAMCIRAMAYHDLVVMFGDVPFTFDQASDHEDNYVLPIKDRTEVQSLIIEDLKKAASYMSLSNSVTVERCSKDFAWAMIARVALTAGGYSLRPVEGNENSYGKMERPNNYKEFYQTAMNYADSVITKGGHQLQQSFADVFVNECNYTVVNGDDVIFEIPFAKESTGNTGYIQGPKYTANEGETVGPWGACGGSANVNSFYRFLFDEKDLRREHVNGLWNYTYTIRDDQTMVDTVNFNVSYVNYNNKWSKLWTSESQALGKDKTGSTGINFPYMRYADVLLMYAEAANELNGGPTEKAIDCVKKVRNRAFKTADRADKVDAYIAAASSQEAFLNVVLDERKYEFAGENIRWRDLVRTNKYGEELVYSFLRYWSAGHQQVSGMSGFEDAINEHDGFDTDNGQGYIDNLPERIYFHCSRQSIIDDYTLLVYPYFYGYPYPNKTLPVLSIFNAYAPANPTPLKGQIADEKEEKWNTVDPYAKWGDENTGLPSNECKYSFYGYIRGNANGQILLVRDGATESMGQSIPDAASLPVVRYILPYPNSAIQRSAGAYKNKYGYK